MHIVVADSSRVGLQILKRMLEERGNSVATFTDGLEAYRYIVSEPKVDVLLTSFELTSMSGLELCWEARVLAQTRRPVYVIAMSSTNDNNKLVQALDSGADDFIHKPPVSEELFARFRAAERVTSMQNELIRLATLDPLTNVYNRRAFFEKAEQALTEAKRGKIISAVMFDIDHFKKVNDTYGHDIGDEAIRQVAKLGSSEGGILGRLGGEEFALTFIDKTAKETFELAEKIRIKISEVVIDSEKGPLKLTCSFGVSQHQAKDDVHSLLKRADVALYHAKTNGRNQVICLDEVVPA